MNKFLLPLLAVVALTSCNDSSSDEDNEPEEVGVTLATTKVNLQFNLPSGDHLLDTQYFTFDDSSTYNNAVVSSVCDSEGSRIDLTINFVHVEQNKWDVYFKLNDEFLNVDGGEIGGTGQNKATLEFDGDGDLIKQVPFIIQSTDIQNYGSTSNIEFDFYSDSTSNFDQSFTVNNLDANGC
tara:strand:+ start:1858 stop:2400 length:543 start_codon:yes stop_codon:yes gene_type:complete